MTAHADVSLANGTLAQMLGQATSDAQRERRSSLELQRGLLPSRLPDRDDVDVAVRYQPSGSGAEVGGDWYDLLVLPSGALGVVIGDVIGHDLRSAARMAQARLNALLAQTDPDFMGTCCYAEVRPDEATATFVLAGHPPPLLVPAVGPALLVEAEPGLPLGVVEDATYPATTVCLPPGAAFVLYTDGLVESRTDSLSDGLQRITDTPDLSSATGVEEIAYRLLATMPEGQAADDVALLVLRNLGVDLAHTGLPRQAARTVR
jgi:serine phosphatase RsbU (regulator of sigma subunit)